MKRKFRKLRTKLFDEDISREEIAGAINRSIAYVNQHFAGQGSWTIREVYLICDVAGIAYADIPEYFPKEDMAA